ncbi:MAG: ABC transporter permease, partial [Cellvibrionaceae bacterium]|nr:ABC transporter permease [Cellvibrionaceae bacterium]
DIHPAGAEHKAKAISLIIDTDYPKQMHSGRLALVQLQGDFSNTQLASDIRRVERAVESYAREVAVMRMIARGVAPQVLKVLDVQVQDQAKPEAKGGFFVGIAIFTMIYAVFISGMNLAIDTSAGERERNSLALMLSLPIRVRDLLLGKLLAVTSFAFLGLFMIVIISKIAYGFVPWQELGFNVNIDGRFIAYILAFSLPVALMAALMQLFVSFMAKTFKEAQSYLTLVLIVPMALAMITGYDLGPELLSWLPISGQQKALMEVVKGNDLPLEPLLIATAITLSLCALLFWALARSLKSEKTIFSL